MSDGELLNGVYVAENDNRVIRDFSRKNGPNGNEHITLRESDVRALYDGKVLLHGDGEYTTIINLQNLPLKKATVQISADDLAHIINYLTDYLDEDNIDGDSHWGVMLQTFVDELSQKLAGNIND